MGYTSLQVIMLHLQGHQMVASEHFSPEVSGRQFTLTVRSGSRNRKYLIIMEMILRGLILKNLFVFMGQPRGKRSLREIAPSSVRSQCQRASFSSRNIFRYGIMVEEKKKENLLENSPSYGSSQFEFPVYGLKHFAY